MYSKIKDDLVVREGDSKVSMEDIILIAPVAKDYLTLLSNQSDNRVKILKALTDFIKAAEQQSISSNVYINNGNVNQPNTGKITPLQEKLNAIDDRSEETVKRKSKESDDDDDDVDESKYNAQSLDSVPIIHSYGHKPKR